MAIKTYLVQFKRRGMISQLVIADSAEFRGDCLIMLDAKGQMVASFSADAVESWTTDKAW